MTFSSRLAAALTPNRLSQALADMRRQGRPCIDLTASNPTRAGFHYPADLLAPLADPLGLVYRPQPLGLAGAREAVTADFARRGVALDPGRVALTSSTSEAYSLLFKLLCDAGDEVLMPQPSYPLFEHLTRLDLVTAVPYRLEYHGRWSIDLASIEDQITPRTRALLIVSPNNPTGSIPSVRELDGVAALCGERGIAVIADEVFADYPLREDTRAGGGALCGRTDVLGFTLGGLSKTIGLPQAKLGWIAVSGDQASVDAAMARLELACDTYLSVSTPVQLAAGDLLDRGAAVRRQILTRVRSNLALASALVAAHPACSLLHTEAGWSAVIQVPSLMPEEDLVLALLTEEAVLVHPGYFFDFASESFLVVSLLAPEDAFRDGLARVLARTGTGAS